MITEVSSPKDILAFEAYKVTQYVERWINEGLEIEMTDSEAEEHHPSQEDCGNLSLTTKVKDTTLTPWLSCCSQPATSNIPINYKEKKLSLPKWPETKDIDIFWILPVPADDSDIHSLDVPGLTDDVRDRLAGLYLCCIYDKPHTLFHPALLKERAHNESLPMAVLCGIMAIAAR